MVLCPSWSLPLTEEAVYRGGVNIFPFSGISKCVITVLGASRGQRYALPGWYTATRLLSSESGSLPTPLAVSDCSYCLLTYFIFFVHLLCAVNCSGSLSYKADLCEPGDLHDLPFQPVLPTLSTLVSIIAVAMLLCTDLSVYP